MTNCPSWRGLQARYTTTGPTVVLVDVKESPSDVRVLKGLEATRSTAPTAASGPPRC